jgi:LysM repeat protein
MEITVQPGDTLTKIAAANPGTTPVSIANANGITNIDDIKAGQVLQLPDVAPEAVIPGEEPGEVSEAVENELVEKVFDSEKTGQEEVNRYVNGDLVTGGYTKGKFTAPGIDVSLEGEGDLDTKPRSFMRETVTKKGEGTYSLDLTKGSGEGLISEAAGLSGGVTKVPGEGELPLGQEPEVAETKPTIEEAAIPSVTPVSATTLDKVAPPGKDIPPTEDELLRLQALYRPLGAGKDLFNGVIEKLKTTELPNTFDAKELYQQLAEDAERDTKKIDDSIAEIAEEKIKSTFTGFNKFLAVLGAAMGAYGSAMTGTPNYALQILNKAIDADQEQFLASKEIRSKTLLDQRKAILQRRSDLLQLGINQADRMLKIAQQQQDNQLAVANMEAIKLEIENKAIEAHNEQITERIDVYTTRIAAKLVADKAQSKEQRELGVKAISLKDADGKLNEFAAYYVATPKEGEKHRESWSQTYAISKILDDIDQIAGTAGAFMPASLSNTKTSLENLSSQLIVHLKELYGMGANFTEYEQALVRQQTPTDALFEQFKVWERKSKDLRRQLIMKHEARAGSQGGRLAQMPTTPELPKAKGMKTGVAKE